jgi:hypothetical protein
MVVWKAGDSLGQGRLRVKSKMTPSEMCRDGSQVQVARHSLLQSSKREQSTLCRRIIASSGLDRHVR